MLDVPKRAGAPHIRVPDDAHSGRLIQRGHEVLGKAPKRITGQGGARGLGGPRALSDERVDDLLQRRALARVVRQHPLDHPAQVVAIKRVVAQQVRAALVGVGPPSQARRLKRPATLDGPGEHAPEGVDVAGQGRSVAAPQLRSHQGGAAHDLAMIVWRDGEERQIDELDGCVGAHDHMVRLEVSVGCVGAVEGGEALGHGDHQVLPVCGKVDLRQGGAFKPRAGVGDPGVLRVETQFGDLWRGDWAPVRGALWKHKLLPLIGCAGDLDHKRCRIVRKEGAHECEFVLVAAQGLLF